MSLRRSWPGGSSELFGSLGDAGADRPRALGGRTKAGLWVMTSDLGTPPAECAGKGAGLPVADTTLAAEITAK
jgi:hypothetical protein